MQRQHTAKAVCVSMEAVYGSGVVGEIAPAHFVVVLPDKDRNWWLKPGYNRNFPSSGLP